MAKKESVQKFTPSVETLEEVTEQALYESEAYGSPQPDAGMETTVMKPVGMGGPVPIVAPKHNTIQLQPIVVPLAVVPYMTQDSDILRTESTSPNSYSGLEEIQQMSESAQAKAKKETSQKAKKRIAAAFAAILSALVVTCYLLAQFSPNAFGWDFSEFDVIGMLTYWIEGLPPINMALTLLFILSAGFSAITFLYSLIGLIFGKYARGFASVLALLSAAPVVAAVIYMAIKGTFVVGEQIALLVTAGVAFLCFVVSVIFALAGSREKNAYENQEYFGSTSEI